MIDRVAEVANGRVNLYKGNYSAYLKAREERIERLRQQRTKQLEEMKHLEDFVERFRYKATKARQAQERAQRLERLKEELIEIPEEKKPIHFNFVQPPRTGDEVVRCRGLVKAFGDKRVYDNFDFTMYRGDKVALVGPNGAGKSTLMKMIAGVMKPDAGTIDYGVHVALTYYAQHQLEELHAGNTVFEELDHVAPGWNISQVRSLLGAFLFEGDAVEKKVSVLSGGEKGRLALAKMLVAPSPAARRAAWRWRRCSWRPSRCCALTSQPTTWTSPAPTCLSRRSTASRAPSCSSRTIATSSAASRTASWR